MLNWCQCENDLERRAIHGWVLEWHCFGHEPRERTWSSLSDGHLKDQREVRVSAELPHPPLRRVLTGIWTCWVDFLTYALEYLHASPRKTEQLSCCTLLTLRETRNKSNLSLIWALWNWKPTKPNKEHLFAFHSPDPGGLLRAEQPPALLGKCSTWSLWVRVRWG